MGEYAFKINQSVNQLTSHKKRWNYRHKILKNPESKTKEPREFEKKNRNKKK